MDDDVLGELLGEELFGCISQAEKKQKRPSQGTSTMERLLSQEMEQREQREQQRAAIDAAAGNGGGGAGPEASGGRAGEDDYDANRKILRSVREIAGDLEDEKARDFFNASGNLEKLLGPGDEDDEGAPDIYMRMFSEVRHRPPRRRPDAG